MIPEKIFEKIFSARFLMAVVFSLSYCLIMILCTLALLKKIIAVETYVALLGTFALIVKDIAEWYYKREDRAKENEAQK